MQLLSILLESLCDTLARTQPAKLLALGYKEQWRNIGPLAFGISGDGEIFCYEIQLFGLWIFSSSWWMGTHVANFVGYSRDWFYE